jgi:hypothetical protein
MRNRRQLPLHRQVTASRVDGPRRLWNGMNLGIADLETWEESENLDLSGTSPTCYAAIRGPSARLSLSST